MSDRNSVTLCMAYYENPGMLARQYRLLCSLPPDLRERIHLIVVDDGSPRAPATDMVIGGNPKAALAGFKLFRMDVDIAWNQDACRNLAVLEAETKWVLLTDIDHMVPVETWRRVIDDRLSWKAVYKFSRVSEPDLAWYKGHPNSWLLTREMFDRAGGYDERFAGWYGTDGDFRNHIKAVAKVDVLKEVLIRVPREVTPDASTVHYERKTPETLSQLDRIKRERAASKDQRPVRGRFPYHRVA